MSHGTAPHEPWALRLPGDEAVRKPGQNLKEWAGDDRGRIRRLFDRVTFRELRDPKLAGAWGEERVGRELAKLGAEWTVLHGVRVGPKADADHVAIGPAGVFCVNTKNLDFDAKVVVSARRFRVNGYSRDYYPKAVREAERVAARLSAAAGEGVAVTPVLVVTGVDRRNVRIKAQPDDVAVVMRRDLDRWLTQQPRRLAADAVTQLARTARQPATWDPTQVAAVLDVVPPTRPTSAESVQPDVQMPSATPLDAAIPGVTVNRWRRYGQDRLYVNDEATGQRLGWRDNTTGAVHVDDDMDAGVVEAALRGWDANAAAEDDTASGARLGPDNP